MIGALVTIIVYVIIFGLLWWLVQYLLGIFQLPDPAPKVIQAILAIVLVLFLIGLLLSVFGGADYVPVFRLPMR